MASDEQCVVDVHELRVTRQHVRVQRCVVYQKPQTQSLGLARANTVRAQEELHCTHFRSSIVPVMDMANPCKRCWYTEDRHVSWNVCATIAALIFSSSYGFHGNLVNSVKKDVTAAIVVIYRQRIADKVRCAMHMHSTKPALHHQNRHALQMLNIVNCALVQGSGELVCVTAQSANVSSMTMAQSTGACDQMSECPSRLMS